MKKKFNIKFKSEYLCIILPSFAIICVILFIIFNNKKENYNNEYNGWYSNVNANTYININDFSTNICNNKYYSPYFEIKDYNLYDYNGKLILEGIYTMFTVNYTDCNLELLFVTSLSGNLYYINNINNEVYSKYQVIKFDGIYNVINMYNDENNNIYYLTYSESEETFGENIKNYLNF